MKQKRIITAALAAIITAAALSLPAAATREDALAEMQARIAGWEEVSQDDCFMLANQYITPNRPYKLDIVRCGPYTVTMKPGTALTEAAAEAWYTELEENGYPEASLAYARGKQTVTETADGKYTISLNGGQETWGKLSLLEVLARDENVERIEAPFEYWTDRVNEQSDYGYLFRAAPDLTEADFPELHIAQMEHWEWDGETWYEIHLAVEQPDEADTVSWADARRAEYAEHLAQLPVMQSYSFVQDLQIGWEQTLLAEYGENVRTQIGPMTVFYRGDLNTDEQRTVSDAVLLARVSAEDAGTPVTEDGIRNADVNCDGVLNVQDLGCMLCMLSEP